MSESERLDILAQVLANYAIKEDKKEFYMHPGSKGDALIIENITGRHWFERGEPENYCTAYPVSYIKTPNGSQVPCTYSWGGACTDWSDPAAVNAYWQQQYPAAYQLGTSTWKYQCHSYAWYQPSTSNTHTILCMPSIYWTDGSYSLKGVWPTGWSSGRKVYYYSAWGRAYDHSAVAVWHWDGAPLQGVKSKWGPGPLMEHLHNYCPYWSYSPTVYIFG